MTERQQVFPFGQLVLARRPHITEPRRIFILGAYPSALHVFWRPPYPFGAIHAIAVDNEPEPFWEGSDEEERIEKWKRAVKFRDEWGIIAKAGKLNGISGRWVTENVIVPLGISRTGAWITDCLDTYRCSSALAARIKDTYSRIPPRLHLPRPHLLDHPSEDAIVKQAWAKHCARLRDELKRASPEIIVTLGNAALRVLPKLVTVSSGPPATKLTAARGKYGVEYQVTYGQKTATWIPLAHPAAPLAFQKAHALWASSRQIPNL